VCEGTRTNQREHMWCECPLSGLIIIIIIICIVHRQRSIWHFTGYRERQGWNNTDSRP